MSGTYLPPTDGAALNWMENFRDLVAVNFAAYGLVQGDADAITAAVDAYEAAYAVAQAPSTRTKPTVAAKDAARAAAEETCRTYAQMLKTNMALTDQQRADLGLNIDDPVRGRIPAPETSPLLTIIAATSLCHTLRYADSSTPAKRAKPDGVQQLLLYRAIGEDATSDPTLAEFYAVFTRQPVVVSFDPSEQGRVATYFGRWATRTGLLGPWSLPVHMTIAGGDSEGETPAQQLASAPA
jgi:hypothetical protein